MNEWKVRDTDTGEVWHKDNRQQCEEAIEEFGDVKDLEIVPPEGETDGGEQGARVVGDVDDAEDAKEQAKQVVDDVPETVPADNQEPAEVVNPEELSRDPINFLERVNTDFVNTIKGKPAISKQGFRFIQREFKISTESEVVQWSDDPLGCVVWAKAELADGYSAEAHGEGYQFESDVSDNEFVRYADTRAKNRAISDLTSAGALAVSELQE